jgi:hypothetical protein
MTASAQVVFRGVEVVIRREESHIALQSQQNGPCPLPAIINAAISRL